MSYTSNPNEENINKPDFFCTLNCMNLFKLKKKINLLIQNETCLKKLYNYFEMT